MKFLIIALALSFIIEAEAGRGYYRKFWRKPEKPKCEPVKCDEGCTEEIGNDSCPICICKPKCPEIQCPPGCELEELPDSPCPTCECKKGKEDDIDEFLEDGSSVDIDERVKKPECPPIECPPGCEIDKEVLGPCPRCKCLDDLPAEIAAARSFCSPPKCPPGCEVEVEFEGRCPGCKCFDKDVPELPEEKPMCSPPKCPPGCEIEKDFEGPCPGCKCKEDEIPDVKGIKRECDPVKCMPGCREVKDEKGCPFCDCKPVCDPPKCAPGCQIEEDPKGPCPGCVCKQEEKVDVVEGKNSGEEKEDEEVKKDCPPLTEDCKKPGCSMRVDENGCDVCKCDPVCSKPKCPRRCRIEETEGECPKCVCPKFRYGK